ncbi:MAG: diacylglyceryl transferase, partial [Cyanobacteria bacterium J06597_16]
MTFPVYFELGPLRLHPHLVMEALAYAVGLYVSLFRRLKKKDVVSPAQRSSISVGALVGALMGAKLLVMLQHAN